MMGTWLVETAAVALAQLKQAGNAQTQRQRVFRIALRYAATASTMASRLHGPNTQPSAMMEMSQMEMDATNIVDKKLGTIVRTGNAARYVETE